MDSLRFHLTTQQNLIAPEANRMMLQQIRSRVMPYEASFFPATVAPWNCLPASVIMAPNSPGAAAPSLVSQFFLLDHTLAVRAAL